MKYIVTNIEYDTDDTDDTSDLPKELIITVPSDVEGDENIEQYISDKISDQTGFCHNGFAATSEIDINLFISQYLLEKWSTIGIDKPHNHDEIVEFCVLDVEETADAENWHSGDVDIAFRRWIEAQSDNQP